MTTRTGQKALISQFMSFTGANEKVATRALKGSGWKLDQACDSYFLSIGSAPSKGDDTLSTLFEKYRAPTDDTGVVTVEGTMRYLGDLGVNSENAEILVALEIVQSPALGEMSKNAFVEAWKRIGADTISKQKTYVASQISLLSTDMALFKRVYKHAFICSKETSQKALPLENAIIYWQLLFAPPGMKWITPSTNWLQLWIDFISQKWTRSVNKDMWNQTAVFFEKTLQDETLGFWSEDGAWPGVIDQFVEYAKKERGDVPDAMETD
ncbi:probable SCRO protein [Rhynchosporium secalis]|uniref:Defective in cullin neddylation protein n=1 Tax=Rhynchosporium secalis TaxID=38038 RepID=A0A1E1LVU3_RHYSE|nr:probable SCRO protein [Rhynchosporium secalis]